jgi:dihydropteroate synthase
MQWAGIDLSVPVVMGILNVTPDSFSDGGDFVRLDAAVRQAEIICAAGAKILDIGGESTRPGAAIISVEEEINRVVPAIKAVRQIAAQYNVNISIDTRRAAVMQAAMDAGADIINDVSALAFDAAALPLVTKNNWPVVLMHMRGTPQDMQSYAQYQNVAQEVGDELGARITACRAAGIAAENICIDPGIGFAKTTTHNIALLQNLNDLQKLGKPILIGVSRKRFIGEITGADNPKDRAAGSLAAALFAVQQGANIIRTHEVAETVQTLKVWQALAQ